MLRGVVKQEHDILIFVSLSFAVLNKVRIQERLEVSSSESVILDPDSFYAVLTQGNAALEGQLVVRDSYVDLGSLNAPRVLLSDFPVNCKLVHED